LEQLMPTRERAETSSGSDGHLFSRRDFVTRTSLIGAGLMPIVDLLTRFAATKNATPAQIAVAWLLAKKPFIVSIPGTRNIDHLRENLGALDFQLTAADLSALDADFLKLTVHGGRMNEMQMRAVERAG
jgi:aryl-alcohol dehydrogenase-like predicted oxidoreductase